jgi:hypothetical protein
LYIDKPKTISTPVFSVRIDNEPKRKYNKYLFFIAKYIVIIVKAAKGIAREANPEYEKYIGVNNNNKEAMIPILVLNNSFPTKYIKYNVKKEKNNIIEFVSANDFPNILDKIAMNIKINGG